MSGMNDVKIKLNSAGIRELLKSPGVTQAVTEAAKSVQNRAGDGYSMNVRSGRNRAIAEVTAETYKARRDNSKNNSLLKALFG